MKRFFLLLLVALAPVYSFAQGCITIFSEDGDRFFLSLNGVQQNNVAQANVRVDGLNNEFYSAKVVFEDKSKPIITKNIPTKDAGTGQFAEVTFKIKKTKDGEFKMRYFGATPVPVNYNPPPDMYVVHYGQPAAADATITQTTSYATTTVAQPAGTSMSISAPGVNMNVNVGDPATGNLQMNVNMNNPGMAQANTTTTTTTTTTSYSSTATSDAGYNNAAPPAKAGCEYPMAWNSFNDAKKTIESTTFEETKLSTAKSILVSNCVSADQVVALCKLFTYEQTKLDFAKFAYSKTTDPGNYFKVGNVFTYDASKTELNEFISR